MRTVPYILFSTLMIGAAAFLAGFVGPLLLSPEANQGPLLGIVEITTAPPELRPPGE